MITAALVGTMMLLGQFDDPTMSSREQVLRQELVTLQDRRPTFNAPITFLSLSAVSLGLGIGMLVWTFNGAGMAGILTAMLALAGGAASVAFLVVGVVMLFSRLHRQRTTDERIEAIRSELARPPPVAPPPPEPPPGVLLLRDPGGIALLQF